MAPRMTFPCSSLSCLPHPKRGIERVEQGRLAERLEQALHRPVREQARTDRSDLRGAVMKTIGISCRRCVNSCWRSGPDIPGIAMSRSRQRVSLTNVRREERFGGRERLRRQSRTAAASRAATRAPTRHRRRPTPVNAWPSRCPHHGCRVRHATPGRGEWKTRTWRLAHRSARPRDGR